MKAMFFFFSAQLSCCAVTSMRSSTAMPKASNYRCSGSSVLFPVALEAIQSYKLNEQTFIGSLVRDNDKPSDLMTKDYIRI